MVHHGAGLTIASEMPAPPVDELHLWYDRPHVRVRSDRTQPRSDVDAFRIGLGWGLGLSLPIWLGLGYLLLG